MRVRMQRNAQLAVVTALVVAGAVVGLGFLLMQGDPARRPAGPSVAVEPRKAARPAPPPPRVEPKRPAAPAAKPAAPAPAAAPVETADACAKVEEILREYDALVSERQPGGASDLNAISNLRERSLKIDQIVEKLAALGPPAVPCLADALRADARAQRIDRQTLEVRALAKIPGRPSLEALAEALVASDAWGVKMTVVAQLAENGGADGLAILAQRLEMEQDFRIRGAILKFLGQRKSEAGILAARRLAQSDENPNVRIAALRALDETRDLGSLGVIEERMRMDPDVAVRQNAIQVYGRIAREQGLTTLDEILRNDPNLRIKSVSILALQEMAGEGSDSARAALERTANDPNQSEDVRARATGALAGVDRARQGTGLPSVGAKLEASEPTGSGVKPLQSLGGGGR
jgi:HEAT repeat protein